MVGEGKGLLEIERGNDRQILFNDEPQHNDKGEWMAAAMHEPELCWLRTVKS